MIARVGVHLPVSLWIAEGTHLDPLQVEHAGTKLTIHAPMQSSFDIRPDEDGSFNVNALIDQLQPVAKPRRYEYVKMNGQFVWHADLLQIDFHRDEFERRKGTAEDPSPAVVEDVVQNIISRVRYTTGSPEFREFGLHETYWITRYLADDGMGLPEDVALIRARVHAPFKFVFSGIDTHSWQASRSLTFAFQPHPWERLYLDAHFLLPEVGPALTLALSAVETAADQLIRDRHPDGNEAESLIRSRRLGQRLDEVARELTGKSLKDETALWSGFNRLRLARNAASHAGKPVLDGREIDPRYAFEIIAASEAILRWVEQRMIPGHQTHRDPHRIEWQFRSPVAEGPST
jgi:hypothetical protein